MRSIAIAVLVCLGGLSRLAVAQPAASGTSTVQFEVSAKYDKDNVLARMAMPVSCKANVSTFVGRNDPIQAPREMSKAEVICGSTTFNFVRDGQSVWLTCSAGSCSDCLSTGQSALATFDDKGAKPRVVQGCAVAPAPAPTPAGSPTPPVQIAGPTAADIEKAKRHFSQGIVLFQKDRNFSGAFAEFEQAYRLTKNPAVLYNLGLTAKELGRHAEAIKYLERYLAETANVTVELGKTTRQIILDLKAIIADVTLDITPNGAKITIDGREAGISPLSGPAQLSSGEHIIEVTADGFEPMKQELRVAAGVAATLTFKLREIPRFAEVTIIASVVGATIRVDGVFAGDSPAKVTLAGGGHTLEVAAPGYKTMRDELVVAAGSNRTVNVELEKPVVASRNDRFYTKWYFWAPIGVIVAGAAIGITYAATTAEDPIKGTLSPGVGSIE